MNNSSAHDDYPSEISQEEFQRFGRYLTYIEQPMAEVEDSELEKVSKLLSMAAHPTSNENEALFSLRTANTILERRGTALTDLTSRPVFVVKKASVAGSSVTDAKRMQALMQIIKSNEAEIDRLKKQIDDQAHAIEKQLIIIRSQATTSETEILRDIDPSKSTVDTYVPENGFYSFSQFRNAVIVRIGKENAWQTVYSKATGIDVSVLQTWRMKNMVPYEAYQKIATIEFDSSKHIAARVSWSQSEINRLNDLVGKKEKYACIAQILSQEFGRTITENSIKGCWDREKKRREASAG